MYPKAVKKARYKREFFGKFPKFVFLCGESGLIFSAFFQKSEKRTAFAEKTLFSSALLFGIIQTETIV